MAMLNYQRVMGAHPNQSLLVPSRCHVMGKNKVSIGGAPSLWLWDIYQNTVDGPAKSESPVNRW